MRRKRQRDRALMYQRDDWQLFLDPATLGQKAGCHDEHIRRIILKELVDNALDCCGAATIALEGGTWVITDSGPGLSRNDVVEFFAVNRPMLSSKLKRRPLRGMLGNGLRVVMGGMTAFDGSLEWKAGDTS